MTVIAVVDLFSYGHQYNLPRSIVEVPKGKTGQQVFEEWLRQREIKIDPERKTHHFYEYDTESI